MKISQYLDEYSSGERVKLHYVFDEVRELLIEVIRFNPDGVNEEFEDVLFFVQLWLFWRFGIDGETWRLTKHSVEKFMTRRPIWRRLYREVGLPETISNFCGNCNKVEKVIKQLSLFGIDRKMAIAAHRKIILGDRS
ncbi:hypothetical protein A2480_03260 [Candidatus Uhrbacteria bacterium RIFOXYC2_FULL_47_19]|uniref:Uncharacterized protein n=1 Tax=Candidatus Uhrbacteria bacterium RIFOXYC2_FULL_47_19 TaxID=1802424 RepID=A0A1F7WDY1_9BACT|nr:MAG: hypothetical protein A2480_03260 [Candidatus Uhrbacteria bacterium RIFOXYC2_FULL_47_19]HCC22096.1 hypothetical protein [Candidatus Uhrbacteria bacterium]